MRERLKALARSSTRISPKKDEEMNRRQFFQRSGLGTASLFLLPGMLSAAYLEESKANDVLSMALDLLRARGAEYADARLGICKIEGHGNDFKPLELFNDAYLGLRFQIGDQSRNVILRKFRPGGIACPNQRPAR
jgi:hypothetical protein